jgi:hypothetical protein
MKAGSSRQQAGARTNGSPEGLDDGALGGTLDGMEEVVSGWFQRRSGERPI